MYLSKYTTEDYFQRIPKNTHEFDEEEKMLNRFQKNEKGELVPLTTPIKVPEIQFRNSSDIQIGRKPCGCNKNRTN